MVNSLLQTVNFQDNNLLIFLRKFFILIVFNEPERPRKWPENVQIEYIFSLVLELSVHSGLFCMNLAHFWGNFLELKKVKKVKQ